jgi:circadian clock protein KaiB
VKKKAPAARKGKAPKKGPAAPRRKKYELCLYVAGATERSRAAVLRARELCETELKGDYELQVVDVYQQPILARDGQILATPTLVRELPRPMRWLIGNLANAPGLIVGMDMASMPKATK